MAVVRWEPFRDLISTQDQLNRMFNHTFSRLLGGRGAESDGHTWSPAVDVYEDDHNVVLKAELPGVDPNDVELRVEGSTLFLKGERKFEKESKEENYHLIERSYGSFLRTFELPNTVDASNVSANYNDGVLTVTLPKREKTKPKTIKIQAGAEIPKSVTAGTQK